MQKFKRWIKRWWLYMLAVVIIAAVLAGFAGMLISREAERTESRCQERYEELEGRIDRDREEDSRRWEENNRRWEEHLRLPRLTIERGVRVTGLDWTDRLEAKTGQSLEFMVKISSNGTAHNVWVQAELLGLLIYKGGLKVDGVDFFGDITKGINIGTVTDCQARIVTWQAQVATASMFPVGTNTLVVPIEIWADCLEADLGEVTIVVERKAPAPSGGGSSGGRPRYDNDKEGGPGLDPKIPDP